MRGRGGVDGGINRRKTELSVEVLLEGSPVGLWFEQMLCWMDPMFVIARRYGGAIYRWKYNTRATFQL